MSFIPAELIKKKRRGDRHTRAELEFLVSGFTKGEIPDYQIAAWLMAVFFKGMAPEETAELTDCMTRSGRRMDFSHLPSPAVDKHSTGGVGDKTSLILAPLAAAAGIPVPMMAGRGLGHTGGTLDKLESIPGFNIRLTIEQFSAQVTKHGVAMLSQTKEICPADMKLYALRDVTGTIESVPLICASIMSKKLAEGLKGLVLDVKFGSGAFMKTFDDALKLAQSLKSIGEYNGVRVTALLTNMNQPLGRWIGNTVEVQECLEIMRGEKKLVDGVDFYSDIRELTLELGAHMLMLGRKASSPAEGRKRAEFLLSSGAAYDKFMELCALQGAKNGWTLAVAAKSQEVVATSSGYVSAMETEKIGIASILLGSGRKKADDVIDYSAGIEVMVKLGHKVQKGQPLYRIFAAKSDAFAEVCAHLLAATSIATEPTKLEPIVREILPTKME